MTTSYVDDFIVKLAVAHTAGSGTFVMEAGFGAVLSGKLTALGYPAISSNHPYRFTVAPWTSQGVIGPTTPYAIYKATGLSTDTLTGCTAVDGTTDIDFALGDVIVGFWTSGAVKEINDVLATAIPFDNDPVSGAAPVWDGNTSTAHWTGVVTFDNDPSDGNTIVWVGSPSTGNAHWSTAGAGAPGGTSGAVQWNSSSTLAGASNVRTDGSKLTVGASTLQTHALYVLGSATTAPTGFFSSSSSGVFNSTWTNYYGQFEINNPDQTDGNVCYFSFSGTAGGGFSSAIVGSATTDHTNHYGNLFFWTRGSGGFGVRFLVDPNGLVGINTTTPTSQLTVIPKDANTTALDIQAYSGQAVPVAKFRDQSNAVVSTVDATGYFAVANASGAPSATPSAGALYFDTTANKLYIYNGTAWKSVSLT